MTAPFRIESGQGIVDATVSFAVFGSVFLGLGQTGLLLLRLFDRDFDLFGRLFAFLGETGFRNVGIADGQFHPAMDNRLFVHFVELPEFGDCRFVLVGNAPEGIPSFDGINLRLFLLFRWYCSLAFFSLFQDELHPAVEGLSRFELVESADSCN